MDNLNLAGIGMTSQRTRERLIQRLRTEGIANSKVLEAIKRTPRHIFVDEALSHRAYEDTALPIGFNQTISQPYIVARMTEALFGKKLTDMASHYQPKKVLEVGTGSGYQTAILAQLVERVYSIERVRALQEKARDTLKRLKLYNALLRHGDGYAGWKEYGPYDAILVAAAPMDIPETLLEQLKVGGCMVIPMGDAKNQSLHLIEKTEQSYQSRVLEQVRFVPLITGL